jgi:hypothetical protein
MRPPGIGPSLRPHPDSSADAASPGEQARRVRPRTLDTSAGEALPGLSPRGTAPDASMPESPRRSVVSLEQLQQWRSDAGPRSPGQAAAGTAVVPIAIATAQPGASSSRPAGAAAAPSTASDTSQAFTPQGRNTLVVLALERAQQPSKAPGQVEATRHGSEFARFGEALLRQQPPFTLDAFLARLLGPDPAQRDAAAALQATYVSEQAAPRAARSLLNDCVKTLSGLPPEQRMLTLDQALQRKLLTRTLKTLLPEADLGRLQQWQAAQPDPDGETALRKLALLTRLGVALRAHGHGGLSGWVQLHQQAGGSRLAGELLDRFKNGPELQLSSTNKARLERAAAEMRTCDTAEAGRARTRPPVARAVASEPPGVGPSNVGPSSPRPAAPGSPAAAELMQALPPQGRNTLMVHAAERALHETGMLNEAEAKRYRSTFAHFADALLQMRPPVGLDAFMERLNSPVPATREAAARLSAAYENGRTNRNKTRTELAACFRALAMVPLERRTFTLGEMLQRQAVARELKTLLPAADHGLLQQVQAAERPPGSRAALEKQTLLIRLGVALRAQGHGGLSGWVQLHRQPGGPRLADELFERIKNGPELKLSGPNKRKLDDAVAILCACTRTSASSSLGPAGPAAAGPSAAAAPAHAAPAPPRPQATDDLPLCDPGSRTGWDLAFLDALHDTDQLLSGAVASHDDLLRDFGAPPSP